MAGLIIGIIIPLAAGASIIFFGVMNMRGDISSLHSYHRDKVAPQNVRAFGRLVGLGTVITGASVSLFSGFLLIAEIKESSLIMILGSTLLCVGLAAGILISLIAIKKYNGSIF